VVAATHRDLLEEVKAGRFREDLYFRLAVLPLHIPSLRERPDDIPFLARQFILQAGRPEFELSAALLDRMQESPWPGNVRELRNFVQRALVGPGLAELPGVTPGPRMELPAMGLSGLPFRQAKEQLLDAFTREYLEALLHRCGGNVSKVARTAGIARSHLHELLLKHALKGHE
jgi:DNA-binding NtrC family response regulator